MTSTINLAAMTKAELEWAALCWKTECMALRARLDARNASEMAESAPCGPIRRSEVC